MSSDQRLPGRPAIGGAVHARLGDDLRDRVNAWAAAHGIKQAEALRRLVERGLTADVIDREVG